ncbi:MAG: AMP-binding protein, partial [Candidatus Nanoarchaeia archaeon]|nr:AMP-binding protein [Candidatus Jingweiarchaeum tengchongense]
HSYIVYGPLSNCATILMYEGAPDYPSFDRFWEIIEKYKVTIFYTAPTAIRTFMKWGDEWVKKHDLSSLRLLGTVGEPINPDVWVWYYNTIGNGKCPIVDTWWQTETGMVLITPLPGITKLKPGSATFPFPGIVADVYDDNGNPMPPNEKGNLVIKTPWPSMLRGLYKDPERYVETYWSRYKDAYLTGDGAAKDEDGYFWLMGRMDDVLKVSGHRIGTMEVESAIVSHEKVAEAAVVGMPHEIKGESIFAYVILKEGIQPSKELEDDIKEHVKKTMGPIARPDNIVFVSDLPKTRSGKIMRRILRSLLTGGELGDVTTLRDPSIVDELKEKVKEKLGKT